MIVLNECRIDAEGKCLIIEATVDTLDYYDKVYIDSVIIDTDETYTASGPSSTPAYMIEYPSIIDYPITDSDCAKLQLEEDDCKCGTICIEDIRKHIRLVIPEKELDGASLNNNIFFVYIVASGYPKPNCPCGMDNKYTMGIAVNLRPIYNAAMGYFKELSDNCSTPKGFIDFILRLKAFKLALKTGHINEAISMWYKLFKNKVNVTRKKGCGCGNL